MSTKLATPVRPKASAVPALPLPLLHKALTKLPAEQIEPGEHVLHGIATVSIDVVISKGAPGTTHTPYQPDWPRVVSALLAWCPQTKNLPCDEAAKELQKALKHADRGAMIPHGYLEHLNDTIDTFKTEKTQAAEAKPKEGATKVVGQVSIVKFEAK